MGAQQQLLGLAQKRKPRVRVWLLGRRAEQRVKLRIGPAAIIDVARCALPLIQNTVWIGEVGNPSGVAHIKVTRA